ncbi:hypothetical protein Nepgr_029700 [Nepenthes gracilis]|uniref:Uncharacterized protein n=1 Tax=Nepenthes gracilis TaxID=150966 RepID=A0AAD3TFU4_NEPGR|nr:hypothetical protein Nepgr_029700 [Nepenthes gracilis]
MLQLIPLVGAVALLQEHGAGPPFWMISSGSGFPKLELVLLLAGLMLHLRVLAPAFLLRCCRYGYSALGARSFPGSSGSTDQLSLGPHKVTRAQEVLLDVNEIPKAHRSSLEEAIPVGFQPKHHSNNNKAENSEHKFEKLVPSAYIPTEASPSSLKECCWHEQ